MKKKEYQDPILLIKHLILFSALLGAGVSVVLFRWSREYFSVGFVESWQYYVLLFIHSLTAIGLFKSQTHGRSVVFILIRFFFLFLIGYPLGSVLSIEGILMSILLCETVVYLNHRAGIGLSIFFILLFTLSQQGGSAWGVTIEPVNPDVLIGTLFILSVLTVSVFLMKNNLEEKKAGQEKIEHLNTALTQLSDANIGFQSYVKNQEFNILMEERKRVSREIHDTVGYALTNIIMMLEEVQVLKDEETERRKAALLQAKDQAQKGLAETRAALRQLRSEEIHQKYGIGMIEELVSAFHEASGLQIKVDYGNLPRFINHRVDRVIFRLIQEGLTNAFRHGMASRIVISFWMTDGEIRVSILDNGIGAKEIVEGIGLAGMRERIEKVNGHLFFRNVFDGFKIEAAIPCGAGEEEYGDDQSSAGGRSDPVYRES